MSQNYKSKYRDYTIKQIRVSVLEKDYVDTINKINEIAKLQMLNNYSDVILKLIEIYYDKEILSKT